MTKNTRAVHQGPRSKDLGRRKVRKGKEGQKEEKAGLVTTVSWKKKSHKELSKMSKMSFLLVCLRYGGPFWIIGDVPLIPDFSVLTTDLTIRPQCLRKTKEHEGMMFVLHTQQQL